MVFATTSREDIITVRHHDKTFSKRHKGEEDVLLRMTLVVSPTRIDAAAPSPSSVISIERGGYRVPPALRRRLGSVVPPDTDFRWKSRMTRRTIEEEREWLRYSMRQSPTAPKEDVLLAHEKEYVERVLAQNSREEARTIGFPMSEESDGYLSTTVLSEDEMKEEATRDEKFSEYRRHNRVYTGCLRTRIYGLDS